MIEDAAQAFGAKGIATSVVSTFSFFPTKNLFALGDGGLIGVNDAELAQRLRMLRFHGSAAKKEFLYVGYNSRLDAMQAAFLRIFLRHLDGWNEERREAAARYAELLDGLVETPVDERGPRLPHVLRPLARARPARRRAAGGRDRLRRLLPAAAAPAAGARATSATPRATSPRPRRPRARTSACRSGPASPKSSRPRSSPCCGAPPSSSLVMRFPVNRHRVWQLVFDAVLIVAAWRLTFFLRFDKTTPVFYRHLLDWQVVALVVAIKLTTFVLFGFYNRWWRYVSTRDMWGAFRGVTVASALTYLVALRVPARAHLAAAARDRGARLPAAARVRRRLAPARAHADRAAARRASSRAGKEVLIVGAGDAGQLMVREMQRNRQLHYTPIGFVDDDPRKRGARINGVRVLGHDRRPAAPPPRQPARRGADRDPVGAGRGAPARSSRSAARRTSR